MRSFVLTAVVLFSLLGCGLSSWARGSSKRPHGLPDSRRERFGYPGKHGFEHPWKHGFDYPGWREPRPTEAVPDLLGEDDITTMVEENPLVCEVCKIVVADVQSFLGNDSSKIVAFLDSLCDDLPAEYTAECKKYVDGWTPFIIDFLENKSPEEICGVINLCSPLESDVESRLGMNPFDRFTRLFREVFKTKIDKIMIRHALGNDYLCEACDAIVEGIYKALIEDHILDDVFYVLDEICSITPVATECENFLGTLHAEIEKFFEEYFNNQTCGAIGLCPGVEVDPLEPFSGIFDDLDMDFLPDVLRPRPRPRPRPDTEPAPRGHPFREHDRNNSRGGPRPGHGHHDHNDHGHRNHSGDRHNHTSYRPDRPHRPYRPFNPFGRDHPHHGHGPVDRPRPDIRRWWIPSGLRPFWPSHWGSRTKPTRRPLDPVSPVKPNKTSTPVPRPETPRPTLPFAPVAKTGKIAPKKPYVPRKPFVPRLPEDTPLPRVDIGAGIPNLENRRPHFPGKHQLGETKGNRKRPARRQRSVVINSINTADLDNGYQFDIESEQKSEVQLDWQCDTCKYGVEIMHSYMMDRSGLLEDKLIRVANIICHRLPPTTVAECKSEVANVLSGLVARVINDYVTPDKVCPFLKLC